MAVPFIFPSVEVDSRGLVDGVISDPLPVDAAQDADLVIALGFDGAMPRRIDRASRLAAQATTSLINILMHARLAAARARGQRIVSLELERKVGLWETAGIALKWNSAALSDAAAVPVAHTLPLLRILQESLSNALKHSRASEIAVTLACDGEALHLVASDNGQGFDAGQIHVGKGVNSMEKRARGIGADLHIEGGPGAGGASVRVSLPLAQQAAGIRPPGDSSVLI